MTALERLLLDEAVRVGIVPPQPEPKRGRHVAAPNARTLRLEAAAEQHNETCDLPRDECRDRFTYVGKHVDYIRSVVAA